MKNIIITFWTKRTTTEKVLIIFLMVAIGYGVYLGIQNDLYVRSRAKELKQENADLKLEIKSYHQQEARILKNAKKTTNKAKAQKDLIDKNLKQDENKIDASGITDDDIADFIAKHQQR